MEYIQFDSSDAIMNFQPKDKLLMMAKYIIGSMLIEKILLTPKENGFNAEILKQSQDNLRILAGLIHGIFSEFLFD